jgi:Transposase zinc-ribbon domain/Phage integrase, N-terminal SAM-like domain
MHDDTEDHPARATADVPALIATAGDDAVRAYRAFLADPVRTPGTRHKYRHTIGRFLRWAERRDLTLRSIAPAHTATYAAEMEATLSYNSVHNNLCAPRGLFRHLAASGALASNPFEHAKAPPVGFPLLDLLAFLAHLEEETLRLVFDDEPSALSLLERVRWPDGPICPHCGTPTFADSPVEAACTACGKAFTVMTNTMFADSPVPVRHWFTLLHRMYVELAGLPDQALAERLDISPADLLAAADRIQSAMAHQRLPAGDDLKPALDQRNRELIEEDSARAIIRYAEMTAIRDRLHRARAEGTGVDDLPPGMTLDEAIARIEERIGDDDHYVFTVEDGLLVRYRVDSPEDLDAIPPPSAGGPDDMQEAPDAR